MAPRPPSAPTPQPSASPPQPSTLHPWLRPLPLPGGKSLPTRIVPGPMEGIARRPFCTVMTRRRLVRCWITPFVRITHGIPGRPRLEKRLAPFLDQGLPVIVQVMGTDIATIRGTVERIVELGPVGIDLNCACPSATVVRGGAGGARLRDPQWIREALCELRTVCSACGLSVKLRTGFESPDEMHAILTSVRDASPDLVILHHRTVRESYDPVPDGYERLARARELIPDIPFFGSGDLFTVDDAFRMYDIAAVDGVAPARGLMRNPWLLMDIETACATAQCGKRPPDGGLSQYERPPDGGLDPVGFLRDLAEAGLACGVRDHGYVLEVATWLLGKSAPLLARLRRAASLTELAAALQPTERETV